MVLPSVSPSERQALNAVAWALCFERSIAPPERPVHLLRFAARLLDYLDRCGEHTMLVDEEGRVLGLPNHM